MDIALSTTPSCGASYQGLRTRTAILPRVPANTNRSTAPLDLFSGSGSAVWTVVDLFSGAGGASAGFHAHPDFAIVAAADAQLGKPSSARGTLACNDTYAANIGIVPYEVDLGETSGYQLRELLRLEDSPTVLIACPPCTGFSRTNASNHLQDDPRNSLIGHIADFAKALRPDIIVMENAREMLMGRFAHHFTALKHALEDDHYVVRHGIHFLTKFGLPQIRERALVVAVRRPLRSRVLEDLWSGYRVEEKATHVRRAIWELPQVDAGQVCETDPMHISPRFGQLSSFERLAAIPHDGGSWRDLFNSPQYHQLLTPGMLRLAAKGDFGSFPDVYGRLWWDRPAATIKRECSHVGNGRYSHPLQNRLCSVREMGILQGFPSNYTFAGSVSNRYRHIGDAVPPLISRQIAGVCEWILAGRRPDIGSLLLEKTHLTTSDIVRD